MWLAAGEDFTVQHIAEGKFVQDEFEDATDEVHHKHRAHVLYDMILDVCIYVYMRGADVKAR